MKKIVSTVAIAALMAGSALTAANAATPNDQLVVAMSLSNVLTLDPASTGSRETAQVLSAVYDTLIKLDDDNPGEFLPALAETWEINEDNTAITFNLRDAQFASGNKVTAQDVVWSLTRLMTLNLANSSFLKTRGFSAENAEASFVAVDEDTVQINLPQADDPRMVMMVIALPGPGSILDSQTVLANETDGDLGENWLRTNSAGSGAFTLTEWRSNEHVILDRSDSHWDEAAAMRRVLIRHLPESQSQRLQLERGDIDIAYSLLAADLAALQNAEGIEIETVPSAGFYYLAVSMKDERLANPKVREALRYLIDYEGLNNSVMWFYGTPHQRPLNSTAMGILPSPGYTLDVERAKNLLAEAGFADGFEVTLHALNEPPFLDAATAIQATLGQAGIRANLITGNGDQVYGAMRERNFQLIVGRGGGGQHPHPDSNLRATAFNPDNSDEAKLTNYQGWRTSFYDEELNRMIEDALLIADRTEQVAAYEEIQNYYADMIPAIQPFSEVVVTAAFREDVEGLTVDPWRTDFGDVSKNR